MYTEILNDEKLQDNFPSRILYQHAFETPLTSETHRRGNK